MPFGRCSAALAQLLHEKTGGNPFFATQFLQELYEAQQLRFDRAEGRWAWDETQIQAMGFTDSAVVLLVAKLERLSARALAVVKEAACMGGAALIADLSLVHGTSRAQVEVDLQPAVRAGLLHRQGSRYRFVHDRVREAAYSLIGEAQRVEVHARIGQLFLSHWSMQVIEEHVFEVADHLNRGAALVTGTAQRKALHVLNLVAGRRARASSAHTSARLYLNAAEATLDTDAWDTRYEQTFGMYLELTESELVAGDLDRAQALNRLLLAHARSNHDRARVHLLHLRFCQSAQRYRESLSTLFAALKDFSVVFPDSDDGLDAAFRAEQEAVTAQVGDRRIADLVDLAPATDADARLVIALLGESFISAFMVRPKLHRLIVARMVKLSLSFGNTEESCRAYMGYAAIVGGMQGNTQAAYEYAHLALRLNDKLPNPRARGRVLFVYAAQLVCWREPIAAAHAVLEEAHRASLEVGDVFMAAASISNIAVFSFERGDPLPTLVERARRGGEFCRHHRIATQAETNRTFEQFARCLQGKTKHTNTFDDGVYSEAQAIEILTKAESAAGKACLHVARQVNAFIGGEHRQALDYAALAATAMQRTDRPPGVGQLPLVPRADARVALPHDERSRTAGRDAHHRRHGAAAGALGRERAGQLPLPASAARGGARAAGRPRPAGAATVRRGDRLVRSERLPADRGARQRAGVARMQGLRHPQHGTGLPAQRTRVLRTLGGRRQGAAARGAAPVKCCAQAAVQISDTVPLDTLAVVQARRKRSPSQIDARRAARHADAHRDGNRGRADAACCCC